MVCADEAKRDKAARCNLFREGGKQRGDSAEWHWRMRRASPCTASELLQKVAFVRADSEQTYPGSKLAQSSQRISFWRLIYISHLPLPPLPQGQQSNSIESEIWKARQKISADKTSRLRPSGCSVPWHSHLILSCDEKRSNSFCNCEEEVVLRGARKHFKPVSLF